MFFFVAVALSCCLFVSSLIYILQELVSIGCDPEKHWISYRHPFSTHRERIPARSRPGDVVKMHAGMHPALRQASQTTGCLYAAFFYPEFSSG